MVILAFALAGAIIFLGFIGYYLFKKKGIPDILILIIVGILIGPVFKIIDPVILAPISTVFIILALIITLFDGGLNLDIYKVIKQSPRAMILAIFEITMSVVLITVFTFFVLKLDFLVSLLLGITLAGACSSVVIPLLNRTHVSEEIKTLLTLESAFTDTIVIVLGLTLIQFLTTAQTEISTVAQGIASAFSIGIVSGILVGIVWLKALKYIEEYDEILTLAIVLLFYSITESLGGNGAIFTLFFGLVLGNGLYISKIMKIGEIPEENGIMKKFHSEISFMIMTFFFVYIGLMVVVEKYVAFFYGIILSFVVLLGRYVSTYITSIGEPFLKKNIDVMRVLIPRALTPAVLSQLIVISGIPNTELFSQIVIGVIITTVVISVVGTSIIERNLKKRSRTEKEEINHKKFLQFN